MLLTVTETVEHGPNLVRLGFTLRPPFTKGQLP